MCPIIASKITTTQSIISKSKKIVTGNRVPKDFFVTTGTGESDITIHAGSYHLALKSAGIESYNVMVYSSILPNIATQIPKPRKMTHGAVLETIMACTHSTIGERATAGVITGWLYDKKTGERFGGLVAEYSDHGTKDEADSILRSSLNELYTNGYSEKFDLRDISVIIRSFVPKKKFGTSLVALCFTTYEHPVID